MAEKEKDDTDKYLHKLEKKMRGGKLKVYDEVAAVNGTACLTMKKREVATLIKAAAKGKGKAGALTMQKGGGGKACQG